MIVERKPTVFQPLVITLETQDEINMFHSALENAAGVRLIVGRASVALYEGVLRQHCTLNH